MIATAPSRPFLIHHIPSVGTVERSDVILSAMITTERFEDPVGTCLEISGAPGIVQ